MQAHFSFVLGRADLDPRSRLDQCGGANWSLSFTRAEPFDLVLMVR